MGVPVDKCRRPLLSAGDGSVLNIEAVSALPGGSWGAPLFARAVRKESVMCGRYALEGPVSRLREAFDAEPEVFE